jgi:hypothetical protein
MSRLNVPAVWIAGSVYLYIEMRSLSRGQHAAACIYALLCTPSINTEHTVSTEFRATLASQNLKN